MVDKERVALVTGGAGDLGRAIGERLARDGTLLVIADIDAARAEAAAGQLRAAGAQAHALQVDVADEASVSAAYQAVAQRWGRLDVLVNNAGIAGMQDGQRASVETMTLACWEQTLRINLTGAFLMCRGAVPLMRKGKWGRIVNISSRSARANPRISNANYAASKAGMLGMTRVLAHEVGRDGITVNCVAPGRMVTAMTLANAGGSGTDYFDRAIAETVVGRMGVPADTANAVGFLCSEEAGFLTGVIVDVTGGAFMP